MRKSVPKSKNGISKTQPPRAAVWGKGWAPKRTNQLEEQGGHSQMINLIPFLLTAQRSRPHLGGKKFLLWSGSLSAGKDRGTWGH